MPSDKPRSATPGQAQADSGICQKIFPEGSIIPINPLLREALIVLQGYVAEEIDVVTDKGVRTCEAGNIEPGESINELALFEIKHDPDVSVRLRAKCKTVVVSLPISKLQRLTQRMTPEDQRKLYEILGQMFKANAKRNSRLHRINAHNGLRAENEAAQRRTSEAFAESLRVELEEMQKVAAVTPDQVRLMCEIGQYKQYLQSAQNREQGLRDEVGRLRNQNRAMETRLQLITKGTQEMEDLRKQLSDQSRWIERNCPDLPAVRAIQDLASGPLFDKELDDLFAEAFKPVAKPPPLPITRAAQAIKTDAVMSACKSHASVADYECEVVRDDELWAAGETELIELGTADDGPTVFMEEIPSSILRSTLPFEHKASDPQPPPVNIPAMSPLPVVMTAPAGSDVVQVTKTMDMSAIRKQAAEYLANPSWVDNDSMVHDQLQDFRGKPDKK